MLKIAFTHPDILDDVTWYLHMYNYHVAKELLCMVPSTTEHCPTPTRSGRSRVVSGHCSMESGRSSAENGRGKAEGNTVWPLSALLRPVPTLFGRLPLYCGCSPIYSSHSLLYCGRSALLRPLSELPRPKLYCGHFPYYCSRFPLYCSRSWSVSDSVPQRSALMGHHNYVCKTTVQQLYHYTALIHHWLLLTYNSWTAATHTYKAYVYMSLLL